MDLDPPGTPRTGRSATGTSPGVVADLAARLVAYLAAHAPVGQLGEHRGAEAGLARVCLALTAWEDSYRTGQPAVDHLAGTAAVADLLATVPEHQVAELVALADRASASGSLAQLRHIAGDPAAGAPLGVAAPVFVPDWADGDLLLVDRTATASEIGGPPNGGVAATLVDVKPSCRCAT